MRFGLFLLLSTLCVIYAYPSAPAIEYSDVPLEEVTNANIEPWSHQLERVRRQVSLQGGGGGSPGKGFDLSIDGRAPVWTSGNGRHSFDVTGGYSQHLGGPYGNSPPQWRGGGVYTFRF